MQPLARCSCRRWLCWFQGSCRFGIHWFFHPHTRTPQQPLASYPMLWVSHPSDPYYEPFSIQQQYALGWATFQTPQWLRRHGRWAFRLVWWCPDFGSEPSTQCLVTWAYWPFRWDPSATYQYDPTSKPRWHHQNVQTQCTLVDQNDQISIHWRHRRRFSHNQHLSERPVEVNRFGNPYFFCNSRCSWNQLFQKLYQKSTPIVYFETKNTRHVLKHILMPKTTKSGQTNHCFTNDRFCYRGKKGHFLVQL